MGISYAINYNYIVKATWYNRQHKATSQKQSCFVFLLLLTGNACYGVTATWGVSIRKVSFHMWFRASKCKFFLNGNAEHTAMKLHVQAECTHHLLPHYVFKFLKFLVRVMHAEMWPLLQPSMHIFEL